MCLPEDAGPLDFMSLDFIPALGSQEKNTKLPFSSGRRGKKKNQNIS